MQPLPLRLSFEEAQSSGCTVELLLRGIYPSEYPGSVVYKPWQIVDVRDCAAGHVGLLESVKISNGERASSNDRARCSLSPC